MNRTHRLLSWFLFLQTAPQFHAGDVILFIDEVHTLIGSGIAGRGSKGAGLDIANLLKPALARGELQVCSYKGTPYMSKSMLHTLFLSSHYGTFLKAKR